MTNFDTTLKTFVTGAQKIVDDTTTIYKKRLVQNEYKNFIRVCIVGQHDKRRRAWCFIDKETGDISRAIKFTVPAKGVRGNIYDAQNGLGSITKTGPSIV